MNHFCNGRGANFIAVMGLVFGFHLTARAAEAQAGKRLMLTVLNPDQQPGAEAEVSVWHEDLSESRKLKTDAKGVAVIDYPGSVSKLQVTVGGAADTVPIRLSWGYENRPPKIPETYTLALEKGVQVKGKVSDDAGQPIGGATVVISASAADAAHPERNVSISYKTLKTKEDGTWSYARLPKQPTRLSLGVYDHRYASTFGNDAGAYSMKTQPDLESLRNAAHNLTLKRGPLIEGVVIGSDGEPLAGASVGIGRDRIASNILPEVKTDAEGRFAIATHPKEHVTVTVRAKDHAPELVRVKMPAEGREVLKIELKAAQTLAGRVVDSEGRPVAKAYVWIDTWREARTIRTDLRTDSEGRFTWNGAPADAVQADSSADGFARTRDVPLTAGAKNEIKLLKAAKVRLEVVDAETGKPVPKFQVVPGILWKEGQDISWQRDGMKMVGKDGAFETEYTFPYPGHVIRIEAEGYLAKETPKFAIADGDQTFRVEMKSGASLTGRVLGPDGQPVRGVDVVLVAPGPSVTFNNGTLEDYDRRRSQVTKTTAEGTFTFPPSNKPTLICVSARAGYAQREVPAHGDESFPKGSVDLRLEPWGRIEGELRVGTQPAANAIVQGHSPRHHKRDQPELVHDFNSTADEEGRFVIEQVRPGPFIVGRRLSTSERSWTTVSQENIVVKGGETMKVRIGGKGRPVIGRLDLPKELLPGGEPWEVFDARIATVINRASVGQPPIPDELKAEPAKVRAWYEDWTTTTDAGKAYAAKAKALQDSYKSHQVKVNPSDGSFRADDIPPGSYTFSASLQAASDKPRPGGRIGTGGVAFVVQEIAGGVSDEPLELPPVPVTLIQDIEVGAAAPDWEAKTVEGEAIKLADFRGRYVLLDFWATWCGPCVAETPNLKRVYEAHGSDKRFAMVALSLDAEVDAPKAYAKKNQLPWVQGFLGDWSTTGVPASYGVEGIPSIWLIGPDGKVVAKNLRGGGIDEAVEKALK